jgi:hypothetical protein
MRWRLVLEEYGPELRYIKGEHNIVADALSCLDMVPEPREQGEQMDDDEIATLFAADEDDYPTKFPLSYQEIKNRQKVDEEIKKLLREKSEQDKQTRFNFGDTQYSLVTRDGKIVVPKALQRSGVKWYHELLMHPGETRTEQAKHVLSSPWASTWHAQNRGRHMRQMPVMSVAKAQAEMPRTFTT